MTSVPPQRPPKRVAMACTYCRRRKIKVGPLPVTYALSLTLRNEVRTTDLAKLCVQELFGQATAVHLPAR